MTPASSSGTTFDRARSAVDATLLNRSGKVFYSGRAAFSQPSRLYILGLNPGGCPERQHDETIARSSAEVADIFPEQWSAYQDECWGKPAGEHGMQPRVLCLFKEIFKEIGKLPGLIPASNVVFVRTKSEADLASEKVKLLNACWKFHQLVIDELGVDTIVCFGQTAGQWVREKLSAHHVWGDCFQEDNKRRWKSTAHSNAEGRVVVTLTHPSRANWCRAASDPSPMVKRVLGRVVS